DGFEEQTRVLEALDYVVATVHMQGFSRLFRPSAYSPTSSDEDAVKARGKEIVEKAFALLDKQLAGKQYVGGGYSIADAALFYVECWAGRVGITLPPNLAAHLERMKSRPAVQKALADEGLG